MGLLDFLFGNKKEKERLERERQEEQERLRLAEEQRIAEERERRLAENKRKEEERLARIKAEKEEIERQNSIEPFVYESNIHQRYENGDPVRGLQECLRTISVEKNTNGCPGYKLEPGIGYIVKIFNGDLGKPNMSDKPMKVVSKSPEKVVLRGYPIEAMSPFGWQEVNYADYGLVVYYTYGKVSKCQFHMYDRNTYIEYDKKDGNNMQVESPSETMVKRGPNNVEKYAREAMNFLKMGDEQASYSSCVSCYKAFKYSPEELKNVRDYEIVGMCLVTLLSFETIDDIDTKQCIASVAFLLLSKGIQKNPQNGNMRKSRFLLMQMFREPLEYTVMSALNLGGGGIFGIGFMGLEARDAIFLMLFCELCEYPSLGRFDESFARTERDLRSKLSSGFFGNCNTPEQAMEIGRNNRNRLVSYLEEKVFKDEDIDF